MPRVVVVRLMSAAGTGFYYTVKKARGKEKMVLRKYDPIGEHRPYNSMWLYRCYTCHCKVSPT